MIRIEWSINGTRGHGSKFPASKRDTLQAWVRNLNNQYGAGTHWIQ